ncbi:ATP-binding protein [Niameybacter massiliensis]|uniref:histidine kinase n=1 Tax=Holtiella tumoricola TaxID=3018743 RepID=A0AA42J2T8_9FIRM|nr:ATP-binding protein [Holtiella tumoricola]MDA3733501.1 ATP-binding protein [Holtiella tumoricola]
MKTSIQWKIVTIYLSLVLVIMVVSGTLIIYDIENTYYEKLKNELVDAAEMIETRLAVETDEQLEESIDEVEKTLSMLVALNKHDIYILDATGHLLLGSTSKYAIGQLVPSKQVIPKVIDKKQAVTLDWPNFASQDGGPEYVEHARPIMDKNTGDLLAIIYVMADASDIYNNVFNAMKTISLASMVAMAIAALFSAIFARMITVPIKQLTKSSKQLAEGSFSRIPIYSTDEIGQLTQSFNYMATELSRTMGAISSEKSKLEKILQNMADGVMAFNRQGVLIHANPVCSEILGENRIDHRFDFIFPKFGVDVSFDQLMKNEERENIKADEGIMMEIEERYYNLHFAPYSNSLGESEGLVVVMQDVTNQQKLDQMRKEFVANVSHELRTPLTTVKSYTETLLDGAIDDREIAVQFLRVMEKEADRMTNLVKDLLELSRIDNKQMQLDLRAIDFRSIVEDTLEAQKIHIEKKGHRLIYEANPELDYIMMGDSARIRQILHNILSNAIKYSIDTGTITVKLYKNKDWITLQVQDTGIGIAKPDLARIFERFFRVDKARSRSQGGTGLGLSIVKEMVELHDGTIHITSKVGKGTTVTVQFKPYTS